MSAKKREIVNFINKLLNIYEFQDYGPNGLQIDGTNQIDKIAFSVSATKESIEAAVSMNANMLVCHHGLIWSFHGARKITGPYYKRLAPLIKSDISLLGYHLPLDAHPEIGNAACIAKKLDATDLAPFGNYKGAPTGISFKFQKPLTAKELKNKLREILDHDIIHSSPDDNQKIKSMGIVTGGANGDWLLAYKKGLDSFLTGEISEHDWHDAKEHDVHMFAGGHHATEQFGIQELMSKIQSEFDVEVTYIDSKNPA